MTEHAPKQQDDSLSTFASVVGVILGVSYPVLAISTGARALYQLLLKEGVVNYTGPALTAVAATLYIIAGVGFAKRERWAWRLSVTALGVETLLTLIVGTLSLIIPETIGGTVWRHFGADYGYFPLVQPLLGLAWLLHPQTLRAYGIRLPWTATDGAQTADG
ncbi:MAG: hypothetical protein ACOCXI_11305 [Chloroflexota bacterium]